MVRRRTTATQGTTRRTRQRERAIARRGRRPPAAQRTAGARGTAGTGDTDTHATIPRRTPHHLARADRRALAPTPGAQAGGRAKPWARHVQAVVGQRRSGRSEEHTSEL